MTNPTIRIHDLETNEVIDREMNAEELAQWQAEQAEHTAKAAAELTKAAEKAAVLAKLGLTADEVAALLS